MKKTIFALALAIGALFTNTLSAQESDNRDSRRAEYQARQTERLIKDLKLDDAKKQQFEPIYQRYLNELSATMPQRQAEERQRQNADNLSDAEATTQLQAMFDKQEQQIQQQQLRLEIQKKYLAEFSAILTPQQLLRVFTPQQRNRGGNGGGRQGGRGPRGDGFGGGPRGGGFGGPGEDF
ncbi:MAG: hypothetical protein J5486_07115 [Bacteroidaceae bacterium]|nr:hypothetical protein [Bacteroidaceae bacterium]